MLLKKIGYWISVEDPDLPDPHDWVDNDWDEYERDVVGQYLQSGLCFWPYLGFSVCRICEKPNGNLEFTDGVYVWPEGLAHYILDHQVRLPQGFVDHVERQHELFVKADRDDSWWRAEAMKRVSE